MKDTELYTKLLGLKHPWSIVKVMVDFDKNQVNLLLKEAPGAKHVCAVCGKQAPIYDHTEEQAWRHLDTCHCETYLHARLPRTKCEEHGVHKIRIPWAGERSKFTFPLESKLIDTLKECDVSGVTRLSGVSWDEAWHVMEKAVERGSARKQRRVPEYIGVDEKSFAKRHCYETIVCDLKKGTVEFVVDDRKQESLEEYFRQFTRKELSGVKAIAMDMWDPYIQSAKAHIPKADEKIVFDRFHIFRYVTDAVDKVRRQEAKELAAIGDDRLKGTRHLSTMGDVRAERA